MKRTPLYERHLAIGGKMVEFGGYSMPVQYKAGVIKEHMATRTAAGLFDVSHMGELLLTGDGALDTLQHLLCNDMSGMADLSCRYSPMCNAQGGVMDDLIVYRFSERKYLLVVNASNHQKDAEWIRQNLIGQTQMEDQSESTGLVALQGPKAEHILSSLADKADLPVKAYTFTESVLVSGIPCLVSRTGYTGEDGFELYCDAGRLVELWDALLSAGKPEGLIPCGLGARDTLRLEACLPLYGHELDEQITPFEAGLGFFVKLDKPEFVGKQALQQAVAPVRRRTGLRLLDRGIAREGSAVFLGDKQVGVVTSGTQLPFVGFAGCMALLDSGLREIGTHLVIDVRGRKLDAEVVKMPFYKRG